MIFLFFIALNQYKACASVPNDTFLNVVLFRCIALLFDWDKDWYLALIHLKAAVSHTYTHLPQRDMLPQL